VVCRSEKEYTSGGKHKDIFDEMLVEPAVIGRVFNLWITGVFNMEVQTIHRCKRARQQLQGFQQ
jgi:hypothetical protein